MTMQSNSATVSGILPGDYGELIVQPVQAAAVALQVAENIFTPNHTFHVPIVTKDAGADWVAEGAEINPDDAVLDEDIVTPAKVAGLTPITRELAKDSSPAAADIVGKGLARSIARKIDVAYFGTNAANLIQPKGLEDLEDVNVIVAPTSWKDLDPFAAGVAAAENEGAYLTSWVAHPDDALLLANLKDQTGSNRPLLGTDPTQPTRRMIQGVPLYVSAAVTPGTVWGIPKDRSLVVVREDVTLEVDHSVYFTSDRVAVKAIMRIGFSFPHEAALQKVTLKKA